MVLSKYEFPKGKGEGVRRKSLEEMERGSECGSRKESASDSVSGSEGGSSRRSSGRLASVVEEPEEELMLNLKIWRISVMD